MNILLYDVDSVMPNIALMKLSAMHKKNGDTVELVRGNAKPLPIDYGKYDNGYASVIFTKNRNLLTEFPWEVGGTGVDINKKLPNDVEHLMPDYEMYPDNEYSIGFLTRGCIRRCEFCFVPQKEGLIVYNASVSEFLNPKLKKIRILDNNLLAYRDWKKCLAELTAVGKRIKFENFDFRLLTETQVRCLSEIKIDGEYIFALDSPQEVEKFEKKMWMLEKYFGSWRSKFYILVGYDTTLKEDVKRINFVLSHKTLPYIMRHANCYTSEYKNFYTDIAAWCNQVAFVKKMSFEEFLYKRHLSKNRDDRISTSLKLWRDNE